MANVAVTNTFIALTTIGSAQVNTNFTDLVTWLNNRNTGSDTWGYLKISATAGNPMELKSSASTAEFDIDSTGANGVPFISWRRSGSTYFSFGVDGAASNVFKFGTTGVTTNVAMQIPTVGAQVQFNAGTALLPGMSFIGDPDTGGYSSGANAFGISCGGAVQVIWNGLGQIVQIGFIGLQDGTAVSPGIQFVNDPDTGIYRVGANKIGFSTGGTLGWSIDASFQLNGESGSSRIFNGTGTVGTPAYTFLSDSDTGMYSASANVLGFSSNGSQTCTMGSYVSAIQSGFATVAGSAAVPSYSFSADVDTGIYNSAANVFDVATAGTQRLSIASDGIRVLTASLIVGSAAIATTATDGFLYIASCAGIPTGVPTANAGRTAMVYDTTNNKFYIYNGSWRGVTLS